MNHQELVNDAVCQFSQSTKEGRQAFANELVELIKIDKGANTDAYRNDIKMINEQLHKVAETNPGVRDMLQDVFIMGADSAGHILVVEKTDPMHVKARDAENFAPPNEEIGQKPALAEKSTTFSNEDDVPEQPPPEKPPEQPAAEQPAAEKPAEQPAEQPPPAEQPAAENPSEQKQEPDFDDYTVKKGDSLWKIAKRELEKRHPGQKITIKEILQEIDEIAKANGIDEAHHRDINKIREGEPLKIPHAKK